MATRSVLLAYPVRLAKNEGGDVLVSFPDVPEALTEGATEREALTEAGDCLIAALGGYIGERRDIPRPTAGKGHLLVVLPALIAAKIALYRAMYERRVSDGALAKRLGIVEGTVRQMLDLDHRSHISQIEAALHVLGLPRLSLLRLLRSRLSGRLRISNSSREMRLSADRPRSAFRHQFTACHADPEQNWIPPTTIDFRARVGSEFGRNGFADGRRSDSAGSRDTGPLQDARRRPGLAAIDKVEPVRVSVGRTRT